MDLPSILIAEDDERTRVLLQTMLENLGYAIVGCASDGLEAVEKTLLLKPGVVLLDDWKPPAAFSRRNWCRLLSSQECRMTKRSNKRGIWECRLSS